MGHGIFRPSALSSDFQNQQNTKEKAEEQKGDWATGY